MGLMETVHTRFMYLTSWMHKFKFIQALLEWTKRVLVLDKVDPKTTSKLGIVKFTMVLYLVFTSIDKRGFCNNY